MQHDNLLHTVLRRLLMKPPAELNFVTLGKMQMVASALQLEAARAFQNPAVQLEAARAFENYPALQLHTVLRRLLMKPPAELNFVTLGKMQMVASALQLEAARAFQNPAVQLEAARAFENYPALQLEAARAVLQACIKMF
jgi:hypothetical protein